MKKIFFVKDSSFFRVIASAAISSAVALPGFAAPAVYELTGTAEGGGTLNGFVTIDSDNAATRTGFLVGDSFIQRIQFPSLDYDSTSDEGAEYAFDPGSIPIQKIDWTSDLIPQLLPENRGDFADFNVFTAVCRGVDPFAAECGEDEVFYSWTSLLLATAPVSELDSDAGYGYATYLSQSLEFLNNNVRQVRSLIGKGEELGWKMLENDESSFSIVGFSEASGGTLNGSYYEVQLITTLRSNIKSMMLGELAQLTATVPTGWMAKMILMMHLI